jgi:hypothetical protein
MALLAPKGMELAVPHSAVLAPSVSNRNATRKFAAPNRCRVDQQCGVFSGICPAFAPHSQEPLLRLPTSAIVCLIIGTKTAWPRAPTIVRWVRQLIDPEQNLGQSAGGASAA